MVRYFVKKPYKKEFKSYKLYKYEYGDFPNCVLDKDCFSVVNDCLGILCDKPFGDLSLNELFKFACKNGSIDMIVRLIEHPEYHNNIIEIGTGFNWACYFGHIEVVDLLYDMHGNILIDSNGEYYGFRWACHNGCINILNWMLKHLDFAVLVKAFKAKQYYGFQEACYHENIQILNWLNNTFPIELINNALTIEDEYGGHMRIIKYIISRNKFKAIKWIYKLRPDLIKDYAGSIWHSDYISYETLDWMNETFSKEFMILDYVNMKSEDFYSNIFYIYVQNKDIKMLTWLNKTYTKDVIKKIYLNILEHVTSTMYMCFAGNNRKIVMWMEKTYPGTTRKSFCLNNYKIVKRIFRDTYLTDWVCKLCPDLIPGALNNIFNTLNSCLPALEVIHEKYPQLMNKKQHDGVIKLINRK